MHDPSETERLTRILDLIKTQMETVSREISSIKTNVREARKSMWAQSTHLIRDFDDMVDLSAQSEYVSQNERQYGEVSRRLKNLGKLLDSPYFGRLDFIEDDYENPEQIYIGRFSLYDDISGKFEIYDWRAPISSMFYDYGIGRARFDAPGGQITGEITGRRQYRIESGRIIYMLDSELTIDDEVLQIELSKSSDSGIKTIINSIQREQNAAIRREPGENVLVFGPAGSGKTSIGLHRIAYLLYRRRDVLSSENVRIFSTNNIFSSYISGVIPELGEDEVASLDFKGFMRESYGKYRFTDMYEQMEYLNRREEGVRLEGIKIKYSSRFIGFLNDYVENFDPGINRDLSFDKDVVCPKEKISELYEAKTVRGNLATRSSRVIEYAEARFAEYYKANRASIRAFFEKKYLIKLQDIESKKLFDEYKSMKLSNLKKILFPDGKWLYKKIMRSFIGEAGADFGIYQFTAESLNRDTLYYEDISVLFLIEALAGRLLKPSGIKHILIDEAQDMGELHHRIVLCLFAGCRFTVLADTDQALYPEINVTDWRTLADLYGVSRSVVKLTKSYRSTYEIGRFAAGVLGIFNEESYFKRSGPAPVIIRSPDCVKTVAEMLDGFKGEYKSVGILFCDSAAAKDFHGRLKKIRRDAVLISDPDDGFAIGITVIPVQYAKGLEFDAVVLPELPEGYPRDGHEKRILYLMCTRAMHFLALVFRQ